MTAAPPDLLGAIVASTRRTVAVREAECPFARLARQQARTPEGERFEAVVRGSVISTDGGFPVIAECKRRSPSRGILRADYDPAAHARAYAAAGAVAVSVLTEPAFFDGSPGHLRAARAAVDLPLLRKDFIVSEYQLVEAVVLGADAVLLIVGALADPELLRLIRAAHDLGLASLVEVHDAQELQRALDAGARLVGVNSRNLRTLQVDPDVLDRIAPLIPSAVTAVAESGIRSRDELERLRGLRYDAFLVGERLITQPDPGAALRELRGPSACG
jgi:indole-3-glycerol phosphate synthase